MKHNSTVSPSFRSLPGDKMFTQADLLAFADRAEVNLKKWGIQDFSTLGLAICEETGELAQAILKERHEAGKRERIMQEAIDLGALCLQVMAHFSPTDAEVHQSVSEQARVHLKKQGWSYRRAAVELGVSFVHLAYCLTGKRESKRLMRRIMGLPRSEVPYRATGFAA